MGKSRSWSLWFHPPLFEIATETKNETRNPRFDFIFFSGKNLKRKSRTPVSPVYGGFVLLPNEMSSGSFQKKTKLQDLMACFASRLDPKP